MNERMRKKKCERKRATGCFSLMKIKLQRRKQDRRRSVDRVRPTNTTTSKSLSKLQLVFTPGGIVLPLLPRSPPSSPALPRRRLQRSLVGRRRLLCGEQVAPLSAAPVVRSAALIFISDSGSHKSKSRGARGATTRSFNFLLWED